MIHVIVTADCTLTTLSRDVSLTLAHSMSLPQPTRTTSYSVSARRDSSLMLLSTGSPHRKEFVHHSRGPSPRASLIHWLAIASPATPSSRVVRSLVPLIVLTRSTPPEQT
jgi:hypothetical protein